MGKMRDDLMEMGFDLCRCGKGYPNEMPKGNGGFGGGFGVDEWERCTMGRFKKSLCVHNVK
jgi:hypothetical protein